MSTRRIGSSLTAGVAVVALALAVAGSPVSAAIAPSLIQLVPGSAGISTAWFIGTINGVALFSADASNGKGAELWRTDGTKAGTRFTKDIHQGPTGGDLYSISVRFDGSIYFGANDGTHGSELWRSNGTTPGTTLLRDIATGTADAVPGPSAVMGGRLYFSASDGNEPGQHGWELWSTNGQPNGTARVKDIDPGAANGSASYIQTLGKRVVFIANDGTHDLEPWASDGTAAGTHMLRDVNPAGGVIGYPGGGMATVFKGEYYFIANDGQTPGRHGQELWRTNGTPAGTQLFKEFVPGTSGTNIYWFKQVGTKLFFSASDSHGQELWVTDGTHTGTHRVRDIWPGAGSAYPLPVGVINGVFYFGATDPTVGTELWRTDGTFNGTRLVKDIAHGPASSGPSGSGQTINGKLVFTAATGKGEELWQTDGTNAGTKMVADLDPGPGSSDPYGFTKLGNRVLFFADDGTHGLELWSYSPS